MFSLFCFQEWTYGESMFLLFLIKKRKSLHICPTFLYITVFKFSTRFDEIFTKILEQNLCPPLFHSALLSFNVNKQRLSASPYLVDKNKFEITAVNKKYFLPTMYV